jgi:predicted membrane protein
MGYERRTEPLLSRSAFRQRLVSHGGVALLVVALALLLGTLGYRATEGMAWIDALLNASMILGGMGPVDQLHTNAGKLFASAYAIFSGVVFIALAGILFAPLLHRLMHTFHLNEKSK